MKIGILIDELVPGSAPKAVGQTARGLEKLGYTCEALVLIDNGNQEKYPEIYSYHLEGVKIRYIFGKRPKWDFKFPGFSFFSLHHIASFFIAPFKIGYKEYDLIIANAQSSAFAAVSLSLFKRIPYIFYFHCDPCTHTLKKTYKKPWLYPLAWVVDKFSMLRAKAIIASSKAHKKIISRITHKPIEIVIPGCSPAFSFNPYKNRERIILAYDRWDIGNNPSFFLDILKLLPEDIKFKIAGFWHPLSLRKNFIDNAVIKGVASKIEILPPLSEKELIEICSKVMLHIHPIEEAFGSPTLESAACGCCVIIPKNSGVSELFIHGVHGYFSRELTPNVFAMYILQLFSDITKAEKMGRNAYEKAKQYTWSRYAKDISRVIKKYESDVI